MAEAQDLRKRLIEIAARLEVLQAKDRKGAERSEYLSLAQEQDVIVSKLNAQRGN
jgi:hypothetical protein